MSPWRRRFAVIAALALTACTGVMRRADSPVPLVAAVDLGQVTGDWYVIACIPTFLEKNIYNAVERYDLNPDGTIATTFRRRESGFTGPLKVNHPIGRVVPGTGNALWGMQFLWPFEGEFRIAHLSPDRGVIIIGRSALDYVWLMSRQPVMAEAEIARYRDLIASWGYDITGLVRIPQRWPEAATP